MKPRVGLRGAPRRPGRRPSSGFDERLLSFIAPYGGRLSCGRIAPPRQRRTLNFLRRIPLNRLLLLCGDRRGRGHRRHRAGLGPRSRPDARTQAAGPGDPRRPRGPGAGRRLGATSSSPTSCSKAPASRARAAAAEAAAARRSPPARCSRAARGACGPPRTAASASSSRTRRRHAGHLRRAHAGGLRRRHQHALPLHAPPQGESGEGSSGSGSSSGADHHEVPSVKQIEEAISHLQKHASVSGAEPSDVAGQPAYTVRVGPKEAGSLFAGAELSFNADNGTPLRAALYSTAELLAGARTGGHRNLLRPGAGLGLLDHPAVQREGRRSQARSPAPAALGSRDPGVADASQRQAPARR